MRLKKQCGYSKKNLVSKLELRWNEYWPIEALRLLASVHFLIKII